MGKREKKQIRGTTSRPRLCVYRSNNHIYGQIIDDSSSTTILACSTTELKDKEGIKNTGNSDAAKLVGEILGDRLLEKNITKIVFDRQNKLYHGRIEALATGVRAKGINF